MFLLFLKIKFKVLRAFSSRFRREASSLVPEGGGGLRGKRRNFSILSIRGERRGKRSYRGGPLVCSGPSRGGSSLLNCGEVVEGDPGSFSKRKRAVFVLFLVSKGVF